MGASGYVIGDIERKQMLVINTVEVSTSTDQGQIVPVGRPVLVTAVSIKSSVANVFHLQSGGATSPGNDFYDIELAAAGQVNKSFKHPLLLDGLASQWDSAGTLRINIAYRVLE